MTRKEAIKFLNNTKVYVNGKSIQIQEKLLSLGFVWNSGTRTVLSPAYPFLFISGGFISRGDSMTAFTNNELREVTAEEILNITIDEPKYRPFKDAKECWNEMLKHHPFGWTKHKEKQFYENWICVQSNGIDGTSFYDVYKDHTFADGTPFGIKED